MPAAPRNFALARLGENYEEGSRSAAGLLHFERGTGHLGKVGSWESVEPGLEAGKRTVVLGQATEQHFARGETMLGLSSCILETAISMNLFPPEFIQHTARE